LCSCVCCAGVVESDYGINSEVISCDSTSDSTQQVSPDTDVNSQSVGKITCVQCSAGSATSTADASLNAVSGMASGLC